MWLKWRDQNLERTLSQIKLFHIWELWELSLFGGLCFQVTLSLRSDDNQFIQPLLEHLCGSEQTTDLQLTIHLYLWQSQRPADMLLAWWSALLSVSATFFPSITPILGLYWSFGCGTFSQVWTFLELLPWVMNWALWLWCFCSSVVSNLWCTERDTLVLWSGSSRRICWWILGMAQA